MGTNKKAFMEANKRQPKALTQTYIEIETHVALLLKIFTLLLCE